MVIGSKNNSRNKPKGKQKLVFAKNKKQAVLAIVLLCLFIGNTLYSFVIKPIMNKQTEVIVEDFEQKRKTAVADPASIENNQQTGEKSATNNPAPPPNEQSSSTPSNIGAPNIFIPIIVIIVLLAIIIYAISKYLKQQKAFDSPTKNRQASTRSGNKKRGKQTLTFAKDPKQAILAIVVLCLFLGNTLYAFVIKPIINKQAEGMTTARDADLADPANSIAKQQQQGLEELGKGQPTDTISTPIEQDTNDIYSQTLSLQGASPNAPQATPNVNIPQPSDDDIEIITKNSNLSPKRTSIASTEKKRGKMVLISVSDSGRSNPFLPAGENVVPSSLPRLGANLIAPPETLPTNSDAGKVMTTTISGILYDKYSPSAIIKIEGSEYLVKVNDIINHYKILSIGKTEVIVQLGKNVYKAGVGELLSQTNIKHNTIANLNKKFGGNEIQVSVKKKGY